MRQMDNGVLLVGKDMVDFSAIYAIGKNEKGPIKIGYTGDPEKRLEKLQIAHWEELSLFRVGWVVDLMLARRIENECHRLLDKAKKRIRGEWFSINAEWAWKAINVAATNLGIPMFTSEELKPHLRPKGDAEMELLMQSAGFTLDGLA